MRPAETLQPPFHLFRREIEADPLPYCRAHDIGVLVYSPLGGGLLTGNIATSLAAADVDLSKADVVQIERIAEDAIQLEGASPEGVA